MAARVALGWLLLNFHPGEISVPLFSRLLPYCEAGTRQINYENACLHSSLAVLTQAGIF